MAGVGVAILAPTVVAAAGSTLRFVAKQVIKGGFFAYAVGSAILADTIEGFNNLVEEARQEYEHPESHSFSDEVKDVEHRVEKVVEKEIEHEAAAVVETLILSAL